MTDLSPTVLWAIAGLLLLIVEIFTLSFVVVFFGVAALIVALLKLFGLSNFTAELLIFGALGAACLFFFRQKLLKNFGRGAHGHSIDHHQQITVTAGIAPHGQAKVEYQGTLWDALNDSDRPIQRGDKVRVVKTEGIKLVVRPE